MSRAKELREVLKQVREEVRPFAQQQKRTFKRLNQRLHDVEALLKKVERAVPRHPGRT